MTNKTVSALIANTLARAAAAETKPCWAMLDPLSLVSEALAPSPHLAMVVARNPKGSTVDRFDNWLRLEGIETTRGDNHLENRPVAFVWIFSSSPDVAVAALSELSSILIEEHTGRGRTSM